MKIAVCAEGANLDTPVGWTHYVKSIITDQWAMTHFEPNPAYVAPAPLTAREVCEERIRDLEQQLERERGWLAIMEDES